MAIVAECSRDECATYLAETTARSAPIGNRVAVGFHTMRDDRYTDDEYGDQTDDTGSSFFPYAGTLPLGWPGRTGREAGPDEYGDQPYDDEPYGEESYDERRYEESGEEMGEGSWWDEGLISLILIAGVVLFLIPEPATSGIGILLIGAGVVLWLLDWLA